MMPDRSCEHLLLDGWKYLTHTKNGAARDVPFAFARCVACGSVFAVRLPRSRSFVALPCPDLAPEEVVSLVFEKALSAPFAAARVAEDWDQRAVEITRAAMKEHLGEVYVSMRDASDDLRRITKQIETAKEDLLEVKDLIRRNWNRLRYRQSLASVAKSLGANSRRVLAHDGREECFVYALVATDEPERLRYIGFTTNPQHRILSHLGNRGSPLIREWASSVSARGESVLMVELWRGVGRRAGLLREAKEIRGAQATGMADLNQWNLAKTPYEEAA